MKKKLMLITVLIVVISIIAAGCTKAETPKTPAPDTNQPATDDKDNDGTGEPDVVSSVSQAPDEETFEQRISKDGNFIIITSRDLTFDKDLFVEGEFESHGAPGRSLALAQYADDNTPIRYTLTVPNIVIDSEGTLLEYGTIKGDVYVQQPGFRTSDATIDGNLYFCTQELLDAFQADEKSEITGEIAVKAYDMTAVQK